MSTRALYASLLSVLAGCASNHSALFPTGERAVQIASLMRIFVLLFVIVYVLVIGFLIAALISRRREQPAEPDPQPTRSRRAFIAVGTAFAFTVIAVLGLLAVDRVTAAMISKPYEKPLRITVTGHQWWWGLEYDDPLPSNRVRTANELYIPVGQPVMVALRSTDVIHSFWVPNLAGKKDLIPGRLTEEYLFVSREGVYSGQCAEYCGYQHAKMRLTVHAVSPERFSQWKQAQLAPARLPVTPQERRGQEVFLDSSCVLCHNIQGTPASASVAPDLTHVGSRTTLAAGALRNTPANLSSWILNPQHVKPGSKMPVTRLSGDDLAALVAYLTSLK